MDADEEVKDARVARSDAAVPGERTAGRDIARRIGVPRSTARGMIARFERFGLAWPVPPETSDAEFEGARVYGAAGVKPGRRKLPEPDWSVVAREMKRKHMTLQVQWEEYIVEHPVTADFATSSGVGKVGCR